jgi:hypothetical protein
MAVGVQARVERGDLSGASVWFRVIRDQWEEPTDENGFEVAQRTIMEAELFEVGPVTFPAFPQTTAHTRAAGFRDLGYSKASLTTLNGALSAAGVTRSAAKAAYASKFLADPARAEEEIRALFARNPELRESVCDLKAATPEPLPVQSLDTRRRKLAELELDWRPYIP